VGSHARRLAIHCGPNNELPCYRKVGGKGGKKGKKCSGSAEMTVVVAAGKKKTRKQQRQKTEARETRPISSQPIALVFLTILSQGHAYND
jgi:hypothetical protein